MGAPNQKCIYCKRIGVDFAREHVIPRAFGTFGSSTMVLSEEVCLGCNHSLGKELDEILARDSFEAMIRAERLPPRRKKKDRFKARRVVSFIPDEVKYGQYRGARMAIDWKSRRLRPLDQVIVRNKTGALLSFTAEEMPSADDKLFRDRPPGSIQIIGTTAGVNALLAMAIEKGARFVNKEPAEIEPPPAASEPTVFLETRGEIDKPVWRAVAKIAFNYLAKIEGAAYVLDEKFDRIRNFIVGRHEERGLVAFSRRPILADEMHRLKRSEVHLVLFERRGSQLHGRVSLFNSFTYEVMLCPDMPLIYSLKSGHAFDPINKKVHKLVGISRSLRLSTPR